MFDMFIEGTDEKKDGRQYITLTDFALPVIVPGGIYAKRVRLVIDVTDRVSRPTRTSSSSRRGRSARWGVTRNLATA